MLDEQSDKISQVVLVPSSGGVHEVVYGEVVLHSKKETGEHPDPDAVLASLAA